MTRFLFASFISFVMFASCQTRQQSIKDISPKTSVVVQPTTVSPIKERTPEEKRDSEKRQNLATKKWDAEDEVETPFGKVRVWAKTIKDKSDELKIRNELYYQVDSKESVPIIRTKWFEHFEAVKLSPNGKWAFVILYIEERGAFNDTKTSESHWLVNLENKDFINRYTIEQRLGLPVTKINDTGLFSFDENRPATVIDSSGKEFDLPNKMPTPRQDLYQAIGLGEK